MVVAPVLFCLIFLVKGASSFTAITRFTTKSIGKSVPTSHKLKPILTNLNASPNALLLQPKVMLAMPVMYVLMSVNEYITHRYYQHAEFNKNTFLQKLTCFVMNIESAPKVKGGGHGMYYVLIKSYRLLFHVYLTYNVLQLQLSIMLKLTTT